MKKFFSRAAMTAVLLLASVSVNAQIDLDNILNNVLGGSSSSQSGSDLVSNLTSVFSSKKQATKDNIIGTWSYTEPAIVFTSDNIIAKAASKVAANKIESKIQSYLTPYGIKPGAYTITFNEDGTYKQTVGGKTTSGKWEVKDSKLQLSAVGMKALSITTQINGKDMQIVTDATKLLNLFKAVGAKSTNSTLKTATTLMKSVNGMQAGLTLQKQ